MSASVQAATCAKDVTPASLSFLARAGPTRLCQRAFQRCITVPQNTQPGQRDTSVVQLVRAAQDRNGQVAQTRLILKHQPPVIFAHVPLLPHGMHRGA